MITFLEFKLEENLNIDRMIPWDRLMGLLSVHKESKTKVLSIMREQVEIREAQAKSLRRAIDRMEAEER